MNLYYFNPDNEMAIAHGGVGYMPPANIVRMARDLGYLPAYLAEKEDCILMEEMPDTLFLNERRELLGMTTRVITLKEAKGVHFGAPRPWGWSPRVHGLLKEIPFDEGPPGAWTLDKKELYSRATARALLARMRGELGLPDIIFPRVAESVEGVMARAREQAIVIKAPWSSSGKGVLMPKGREMDRKETERLSGVLREQGYVMVENRLNKVIDFAMEFWMEGAGDIRYMGLSTFFTGERGDYRGNYVAPQARVERAITRYTGEVPLQAVRVAVTRALRELLGARYRGPLGVDMMLYRDEEGVCRVHPCVEINLRYNMGIVALFLYERYLSPGSEGIFRICYSPRAGEAYRICRARAEEAPFRGEAGRILSGYLPLTPVNEATRFVAEITCHETIEGE